MKRQITDAEVVAALAPFLAAYEKVACAMVDPELDNEQPESITVPLGAIRKAQRLVGRAEVSHG